MIKPCKDEDSPIEVFIEPYPMRERRLSRRRTSRLGSDPVGSSGEASGEDDLEESCKEPRCPPFQGISFLNSCNWPPRMPIPRPGGPAILPIFAMGPMLPIVCRPMLGSMLLMSI